MFLGEDLLAYLVLAFGGALFVGNVLALLRPPVVARDRLEGQGGGDGEEHALDDDDGDAVDRPRPPLGRTVLMATIGLFASIWGLASLLAG